MGLFGLGKRKRKGRTTDRRAGHVPHVGKQPRARNKDGTWRRSRSDKGKKRRKKRRLVLIP